MSARPRTWWVTLTFDYPGRSADTLAPTTKVQPAPIDGDTFEVDSIRRNDPFVVGIYEVEVPMKSSAVATVMTWMVKRRTPSMMVRQVWERPPAVVDPRVRARVRPSVLGDSVMLDRVSDGHPEAGPFPTIAEARAYVVDAGLVLVDEPAPVGGGSNP